MTLPQKSFLLAEAVRVSRTGFHLVDKVSADAMPVATVVGFPEIVAFEIMFSDQAYVSNAACMLTTGKFIYRDVVFAHKDCTPLTDDEADTLLSLLGFLDGEAEQLPLYEIKDDNERSHPGEILF